MGMNERNNYADVWQNWKTNVYQRTVCIVPPGREITGALDHLRIMFNETHKLIPDRQRQWWMSLPVPRGCLSLRTIVTFLARSNLEKSNEAYITWSVCVSKATCHPHCVIMYTAFAGIISAGWLWDHNKTNSAIYLFWYTVIGPSCNSPHMVGQLNRCKVYSAPWSVFVAVWHSW